MSDKTTVDIWDVDSHEEAVSSDSAKRESFKEVNGRVRISIPTDEGVEKASFRVVTDLFIKDACVAPDGTQVHCVSGQRYSYLLKEIPKPSAKDSEELDNARYATFKFLKEIDEAIRQTETNRFIQTIFGLKYLDFGARGRVFTKKKLKAW